MTPDEFRALALSFTDAAEGAHMGHADFRVRKRIFATLGAAGPDSAMVKLEPAQQEMLIAAEPGIFAPAAGAWGRGGATLVALARADTATAQAALRMAWQNASARR